MLFTQYLARLRDVSLDEVEAAAAKNKPVASASATMSTVDLGGVLCL